MSAIFYLILLPPGFAFLKMSEPASGSALLGADESSWLLTTDGLRARRQQLHQGKRKQRKAHPLHDLALLSPCAEDAPPAEDPLGSPEKVVFGMALRKTRSRRLNQVFSPRRNAKTQAKRREVQGALARRVVQGPAQALPTKLQARRLSDQRSPQKPATTDDGRSERSSPGLSNAEVAVQQRRALRAVELAEAGLLLSPLSGAQAAVAEALKEWDIDHSHAPALTADASDLVHTMQCSEEGSGQSALYFTTAPAPTSRWTTASTVVAASALGVAALLARRIR